MLVAVVVLAEAAGCAEESAVVHHMADVVACLEVVDQESEVGNLETADADLELAEGRDGDVVEVAVLVEVVVVEELLGLVVARELVGRSYRRQDPSEEEPGRRRMQVVAAT